MQEGTFCTLDLQLWHHVLAAGSRLQASMCCCTAGCTYDVFEICRASASVYSVHNRAQFEVNMIVNLQTAASAAPSG